jgi:adenine-specific DNA-methyltransferase
LLQRAHFKRLHVFESRQHAFRDDDVLQENVIFHVQRAVSKRPPRVALTTNTSPGGPIKSRSVSASQVVRLGDPEYFIHLILDEDGDAVSAAMDDLPCRLTDLGLSVSTGRVVDFRSKSALRADPGTNTVPLIYPLHLRNGSVEWPVPGARKPNAIVVSDETAKLLVPDGDYVLVRRFSAKEEARRVVATYLARGALAAKLIGFENHLNFFHVDGAGIPDPDLARGLAVYLNSRFVDGYVRQFNGHTQVNAGDLRNLRYPDADQLRHWGRQFGDDVSPREVLDVAVEAVCL